MGIAPPLAQLAGGIINDYFGSKGIFLFLTFLSLLLLALIMIDLKETHFHKSKNIFSQIEINSSEYIESFFYIVEFLVENKGYQLSNSFFQKEITKEHNTNSMLRLYLIMSETLFSNDKFIEARNITNNGLEIFLKNERLL